MVNKFGEEMLCYYPDQCEVNGTKGYCLYFGNPDFEVTSFDNIFKSILNIFIIITLEGWSDIMYAIRHALDTNTYDIFFLICVVFGTFFVLNLMIAVQFSYL